MDNDEWRKLIKFQAGKARKESNKLNRQDQPEVDITDWWKEQHEHLAEETKQTREFLSRWWASHRNPALIVALVLGVPFLLLALIGGIAHLASDSSSSGNSSTLTRAQQCRETVGSAMDRSLRSYYGDENYTPGNSYTPGSYPYRIDQFPSERATLATNYGPTSGEVEAFDAALAEVKTWHQSGGSYTYNTMINRGANAIADMCNSYY